jgi:amino acid adenylation domain-containing protein
MDTEIGVAVECVHHLFEQQVARAAGHTALVMGDQRLEYGALNARANKLAWHLRDLGVGPDVLVGVCLPRSFDLIVAILSVLKAGGAVVPFDPAYPTARLEMMCNEVQLSYLVTETGIAQAQFPRLKNVVLVDEHASLISRSNADNPPGRATADSLAYVIFTSGSSGQPKGTMVTHGNLTNRIPAFATRFELDARDVHLMLAPVAHAASLRQYLEPLCHGATVVLACDDDLSDLVALAATVKRAGITVLFFVPSHLGAFAGCLAQLEGPRRADLLANSVRMVGTLGEPLLPEIAAKWLDLGHGARLFQMYGLTETAGSILFYEVTKRDLGGRIPIGTPLSGATLHTLDDDRRPVPGGTAGELYVGGPLVARGYWNRPEKTAEKFVRPFGPDDGNGILYRTGDRVRIREDGNVEFVGRVDDEIKLHGAKVAPEEIRALLGQHPAVAEAFVAPRETSTGDKRLLAYYVPSAGSNPTAAELRAFVRGRLPEYMVPAMFVRLDAIPRLPNGKVDRRALPSFDAARALVSGSEPDTLLPGETDLHPHAHPGDAWSMTNEIAGVWAEVLGVDRVGIHENFFDIGGTSLHLVEIFSRLRTRLGAELAVSDLIAHPTVARLVEHLATTRGAAAPRDRLPNRNGRPRESSRPDIAIVGLGARFPGARDVHEFWTNLRDGVESITTFTDDELRAAGVDEASLNDPNYVKSRPRLAGVDLFDAAFFAMSPREAMLTEPTHRLFLECAWEALENAGYAPQDAGRVGVYAGAGPSFYSMTLQSRPLARQYGRLELLIGSGPDFLATRVSYKLNLTGPSMSVQTTCSTSLVATVLACKSLLNHECDMALAGGAYIDPFVSGYHYGNDVLSPDGHTRAFDARGRGTVFGDGVGVVVLKRLADALASGDQIHAVIRGVGLNNDGSDKVGYTAPSLKGQMGVIRQALDMADIDPDTISYIEAHGTGTPLGDPIEVGALTRVFRERTPRKGFCAIGSVKTNVGHLNTAAGVCGLIKTVLALENRQLPPSLNFENPNPEIDFGKSPFFVNTRLQEWHSEGPRRAGVSSFGVGGTNAHVILEEAPPRMSPQGKQESPERPAHLFLLSAKTAKALAQQVARHALHLKEHPELRLADVCHTACVGRTHFDHRLSLVVTTREALVAALEAITRGEVPEGCAQTRGTNPVRVAFLFTGQGSQYAGMGRVLFETQPVFRRALEKCAKSLDPLLGRSLLSVIHGSEGQTPIIDETAYTQPALFALEYSLSVLWDSWGVRPAAVIGHSVGEVVAACVAGAFSLEDGLRLIAARGRLMGSVTKRGAMVSVRATEENVRRAIAPYVSSVSIAAINTDEQTVISGEESDVLAVASALERDGVETKRLKVSHAFHSPLMAPIVEEFRRIAESVHYSEPRVPLFGNVDGQEASRSITDPDYWVRHILAPVRFMDGVTALARAGITAFVEVGPSPTLLSLAQSSLPSLKTAAWLPSLSRGRDDWANVLRSLGELYVRGASIDWKGFDAPYPRLRVSLPTYPFQRERQWIDLQPEPRPSGGPSAPASTETTPSEEAAPRKTDVPLGSFLVEEIRKADATNRPPLMERLVRDHVSRVLHMKPASIEGPARLTGLGLDSLMAVELRNALEDVLGIALPTNLIWKYPTLDALTAFLSGALVPGSHVPATLHAGIDEIPRRPAGADPVFTITQEMFVHEAHHPAWLTRFAGKLDERALRSSIDEIFRRHELLRSRFAWVDGRVSCSISSTSTHTFESIDLAAGSGTGDAEKRRIVGAFVLDRWKKAKFAKGGPTATFKLLRLGSDDHFLLSQMDHLLTDRGGTHVFTTELLHHYRRLTGEPVAALPELPIQYADFAAWERTWMESEQSKACRAYWEGQLVGVRAEARLPRPVAPSGWEAAIPFDMMALSAISRREGITVFSLLFTAFKTLLFQLSGEPDAIILTIVNPRSRRTEGLIGPFERFVPIRFPLNDKLTFREVAHGIHELVGVSQGMALGAAVPKNLGQSPLFNFQPAPVRVSHTLKDLTVSGVELEDAEVRLVRPMIGSRLYFPLRVSNGKLIGEMIFRRDVFDSATIQSLVRAFDAILSSALAHPETRVTDLPRVPR